MYRVAYFGFSCEMVQFILDYNYLQLERIYCDDIRVSLQMKALAKCNEIELVPVQSKADFDKKLNESPCLVDFFIVYKSTIIIGQNAIKQYDFFNFHCGNLRTNRGAHSLAWPILLGHNTTCMTLHKITAEVDKGLVVGQFDINVTDQDTPQSLNSRLEIGIPKLLDDLVSYKHGYLPGELVVDGIYYPKVTRQDYTIDLDVDSIDVIQRKLRSQREYRGAIVHYGNVTFYCKFLLSVQSAAEQKGFYIEQNVLILYRQKKRYEFLINSCEGY